MTETRVQSPADTPVKFELMEADDYRNYLLHNPTEISFLLRGLLRAGDLITAFFDEGNDFLLTALLDVEDDGLVLDYGASAEMNRKALSASKLTLIGTHDKVKIQFSLAGVEEITFRDKPAFRAPLPEQLLRLQRREYYRLTAPIARPLKCVLTVVEQGRRRKIEAQVVDISGGGVAVMAAPTGTEFSVDQRFESCQIDLPDVGTVVAGLRVRSVFEVTLRNGTQVKRCGCQFVELPRTMVSMVERYIMKIERERKARGVGAG
ncbi:MAG: flagellar brake protein [Rhodocyclaceae bacterium]|jgi:flagellar brake protein